LHLKGDEKAREAHDSKQPAFGCEDLSSLLNRGLSFAGSIGRGKPWIDSSGRKSFDPNVAFVFQRTLHGGYDKRLNVPS